VEELNNQMDLIEGGTIRNLKDTLEEFLNGGEEESKYQAEMDAEFKKISDIVNVKQ
jgi:hypothetical protein